jgi:hypothetical protein
MASPRTIDHDAPFDEIDDELAHTDIFLRASILTLSLAPTMAGLRTELPLVRAQESEHQDAVHALEAQALFIDDDCNGLVDETKILVLAEVKGNYQAPFYRQIFLGMSPSQVKRPTLGEQLTQMRTWPSILASTATPALHDLGKRIAAAVARGDEVTSLLAGAQSRLDAFLLGPRAAFVDKVNAARNLAYGKLAEIEHSQPAGALPAGFAERFFLHDTSGGVLSMSDIERTIQRLQKKLTRYQGMRAEQQKKQADALQAQQDAELTMKKEQLAAAQKKAQDAAKELTDLEDELAKQKPKAPEMERS